MYKTKFVLKMLAAIFAVLIISSPATADEKATIYAQLGHTGRILSVMLSPDGRYIASGGDDNLIKLWDVASGKEIRSLHHKARVFDIDFSLDSKFIYSVCFDETVNIWEVSTGKQLRTFRISVDKSAQKYSAAISPDKRYAALEAQGTLYVAEISTGRTIKKIETPDGVVWTIAFSPDGKYILTGGGGGNDDYPENTVRLWHVRSGKQIIAFKGYKEGFESHISSVAFSPDGSYAVAGNYDGIVKLWNISSGEEIWNTDFKSGGVSSVAFSPDGRYIALGGGDVRLWEASTGMEIRTLTGHTSGVSSIAFSPDGRYIVSGSEDKTVRLWEASTGKEIQIFAGNVSMPGAVTFSPDGKYILAGGKEIKLWDTTTGREINKFKQEANKPLFSPDGKYILSGKNDMVMLWDVETGRKIRTLYHPVKKWGGYATFSSDGRHIITGGNTGIKIWDMTTYSEIKFFKRQIGYAEPAGFVFSPDGRYALTNEYTMATQEWGAILWDIYKGETRSFKGDSNGVLGKTFSPDGRYVLAQCGVNGRISLWDVATGREAKIINKDVNIGLGPATFFPDGKQVLTSSSYMWTSIERALTLRNVSTWKEIRTFIGHSALIHSIAISPDIKYAVSSSRDGTSRLWDINTGKEIARFVSFSDGEWIVITPEGYFNASPNGAKYLNVRVGNKVYSIDNFYEKYYNPVYVASVLQGKKIEPVTDIKDGVALPPVVRIISPETNSELKNEEVTITVSAKDIGGGIDEIRLYHNGKAVGEETRGVKIIEKDKESTKSYTIILVDGLNNFRAIGFSRDRTQSNPSEIVIKLLAPEKEISMYVLAVGINKYKNPALNLNYAEPDAKGIVDFFRQSGTELFKKVEIRDIYNEQATKEGILLKLKELQSTNPQDAVLIYLAGHGENINEKWYFIPHELTYPEREDDVKTKAISADELSNSIKNIKAQKVLVMIDACKSGAVLLAFRGFEDRKALAQLSRSTGVHIVAASNKDQYATEVKELGHGVFTYTLLEGLKGKAAAKGEAITVRKLMSYIEEQLPELTKKYRQEAQYPVVDSRGMDFPLVIWY